MCVMNDTIKLVMRHFVQQYPGNSSQPLPLKEMPNEIFELCNVLWKTQRTVCQNIVVTFFRFVLIRMDAVEAACTTTSVIPPWDEDKLKAAKEAKQNPIESGLISLLPPVNDVYYMGGYAEYQANRSVGK